MPTQPEETALEALRAEATRRLALIAEESGADSRLHQLCSEAWQLREEDARLSLRHGDAANAVVILERALHLLALGPSVLARNELALDDLALLLQAA